MRKILSGLFYASLRAAIFPAAVVYLCIKGNAHTKYWKCGSCGALFSGSQQDEIDRHSRACWPVE